MIGKKISFYLFQAFNALLKIIPFWFLYRLSGIVYIVLFYVVAYRKSVVIKNLRKCFPDKSEKELKVIMKRFYKMLSDLFLETAKAFSMSKVEMIKRFKAINSEIADKYFDKGKDVIVLLGHFANWEWGLATVVENFKHQPAVLYKPISNQFIEKYINANRAKFGAELVSIYETNQYFMKKKPKPVAYYMAADQYPPLKDKQRTAVFFSSETAFLYGPEKYSKLLDIPIVYIEIQRSKRGYYTMEMIDVIEYPGKLEDNELTQMYATLLEKSIKKQPENWIWSHKRWKRELY